METGLDKRLTDDRLIGWFFNRRVSPKVKKAIKLRLRERGYRYNYLMRKFERVGRGSP